MDCAWGKVPEKKQIKVRPLVRNIFYPHFLCFFQSPSFLLSLSLSLSLHPLKLYGVPINSPHDEAIGPNRERITSNKKKISNKSEMEKPQMVSFFSLSFCLLIYDLNLPCCQLKNIHNNLKLYFMHTSLL